MARFGFDHKAARAVLLALIIGVAIFLRTYSLDTMPPGLFHDEAANGLDVLDILQGKLQIFFERNNGREPLFIYLQAISVYFLGNTAFALRLVAAGFGVLTIWATYLLANEWFGYRVGLVAAAGLAISFWHIVLSRVGLRAITIPFFLLLILYFLGKALNDGRSRFFSAAGALAGLSLYTYTSARLVPLLLATILTTWYFGDRQIIRIRWRRLTMMILAALTVASPLLVYFAFHPDILVSRTFQVSIMGQATPASEALATVLKNVLKTAGMFFVAGDQNWRQNYAGRPVFNPLFGALFAVGLFDVLANLRRSRESLWLALWFAIFLLPGLLSTESPHFLRLTAIAPATYILAALGIRAIWSLARKLLGQRASWIYGLTVLALLASDGAVTFQAYFEDYATRPEVYWAFSTNWLDAAQDLRELNRQAKTQLAAIFYGFGEPSPTIGFLAPDLSSVISWVPEDAAFIRLAADVKSDAVFLTTPSVNPRLLPSIFPSAEVYRQWTKPGETVPYSLYRVPANDLRAAAIPQRSLAISFGDEVELVGATIRQDLAKGIAPGQEIDVDLIWRLANESNSAYNFFVHLIDRQGKMWGQKDVSGSEISGWHQGDLLITRHDIKVPFDVPSVPLKIIAGATRNSEAERLKPNRGEPGDVVAVGEFAVARYDKPAIQHQIERDIGGEIRLLGYDLASDPSSADPNLDLTIYWQALVNPTKDLTVFVHLLDDKNQIVAQQDNQPGHGSSPTGSWLRGEIVADHYHLGLSEAPATGSLEMVAGIYDGITGARLEVAGNADGQVHLGSVKVRE